MAQIYGLSFITKAVYFLHNKKKKIAFMHVTTAKQMQFKIKTIAYKVNQINRIICLILFNMYAL